MNGQEAMSFAEVGVLLAKYIGLLALFVPALWLVAEGLAKAFNVTHKGRLAMVLGPVFAVLLYMLGMLPHFHAPMFVDGGVGDHATNIAFALMLGLMATFGSGKLHEVVKTLRGGK